MGYSKSDWHDQNLISTYSSRERVEICGIIKKLIMTSKLYYQISIYKTKEEKGTGGHFRPKVGH